jgi:hypothetical protein
LLAHPNLLDLNEGVSNKGISKIGIELRQQLIFNCVAGEGGIAFQA